MFVETLIHRLACSDQFLFKPEIVAPGWENNFIVSLSTQLSTGSTLTEKQANLSNRLIRKYKTQLEAFFNTTIDVDNPVYAHPFRKLHVEKTIAIKGNSIQVRFPYNEELIKRIQDYITKTAGVSIVTGFQNSSHKTWIGAWDHEEKVWAFSLREETILWLGSHLLPQDFKADDTFIEWYNTINDVIDRATEYAITAVKTDAGYNFVNASSKIPSLDTDNVLEFLFHAKNYGVSIWDNAVDNELRNSGCSPVTTALLNATIVYVDSREYSLDNFKEVLLYGGPTLIVIPGGSEIKHTEAWHKYAASIGIDNKDIAVMFRTPNQDNGGFNQYVKENSLNNNIHDDTKIVFVSTKIPKPLVKSGIGFNTVINLGYYNNMHFSMNILLTSPANIVYYNDKKPQGATICLPQN